MPTARKAKLQQTNGQSARRQSKNQFWGETYEEVDQKVEEYNRFLNTLSDEAMARELRKLSPDEVHFLAWTTTYLQHHKRRRKGSKK